MSMVPNTKSKRAVKVRDDEVKMPNVSAQFSMMHEDFSFRQNSNSKQQKFLSDLIASNPEEIILS